MTAVRNKLRRVLSDYNADRRDLFTVANRREHTKQVPLRDADRFIVDQLWADHEHFADQLLKLGKMLKAVCQKSTHREKEAREVLKTVPGVGPVTIEVLLSELGDVTRFRNAKAVCSYAGLAPVVRQSGGKKSKDLGITKEGSGLLRWVLVEAAGVWFVPVRSGNEFTSESAKRAKGKAGDCGDGAEAAVRDLRDAQDNDTVPHLGGIRENLRTNTSNLSTNTEKEPNRPRL